MKHKDDRGSQSQCLFTVEKTERRMLSKTRSLLVNISTKDPRL